MTPVSENSAKNNIHFGKKHSISVFFYKIFQKSTPFINFLGNPLQKSLNISHFSEKT